MCCPPRNTRVLSPPPTCCRCYRKGCFFHHMGINVRKHIVSVGFQETCRRFLIGDASLISVTAKKKLLSTARFKLPVCFRYRKRTSPHMCLIAPLHCVDPALRVDYVCMKCVIVFHVRLGKYLLRNL